MINGDGGLYALALVQERRHFRARLNLYGARSRSR